MEREANYIAVGIFVLLMLVMGVLFVYWYSDSRDHLDYQRYEIYFDGTVSGLLYIDLEQQREDDSRRRVLAAVPSERYPVIRSAHSDLDQFLSSLPTLTARLNELVDRASRVLSDGNIQSVARIIFNVNQAASGLPRTARNIDTLVDTLNEDSADAKRLITDLHASTRTASVDFLAAMQKLRATSDNLASASGTLNAFA